MISKKTKNLALMGMFIALCAIGATIKVPSPTGTVAFDSAPGFMAAIFLGPRYGAITAALGHFFTSLFAGFPMSIPMHLFVACQMAFFAWAYGIIAKKNLILGTIVASLLNAVLAPALMIPFFGVSFFTGMIIPLLVASFANVFAATIIYKSISASNKVFADK